MFVDLGVYAGASAPAEDVTPPGTTLLSTARCNTIEITGRVSAGTGKLYILRKVVYLTAGVRHYQFRPWTEDRPADSADFVDGYFTCRLRLRQDATPEEILLWNPGNALTIDPARRLLATMSNY